MNVKRIYAVVSVADIDASVTWYARLFGRDCDERPMKEAAQWKVAEGGFFQVVHDVDRAGKAMVTVGVEDIERLSAELKGRGFDMKRPPDVGGPFRLAQIADPDGNQLTFAEDTRQRAVG